MWYLVVGLLVGLLSGRCWAAMKWHALAQGHAARELRARVAVGKAVPLVVGAQDALGGRGAGGEALTDEGRSNVAASYLGHALHLMRALTWGSGRYWRHVRRGTYYEVLSYELNLQVGEWGRPMRDGDQLVLYIDTRSGRLSARHPVEFHDGRFTRASRDEALGAAEVEQQRQAQAGEPGRSYVDPDADLLGEIDRRGAAAGDAPGDYRPGRG